MAKKGEKAEKKSGSLVPWSRERDMEQMFENFFERRPHLFWPWRSTGMEITTPTVDLYEEKDDIVVKADLPGLEKDDIEVNLSIIG